ncbi:MAG: glycosyl hydrolase-related protein [Planctomycetota bacterium]|jgi:hypothetical protein
MGRTACSGRLGAIRIGCLAWCLWLIACHDAGAAQRDGKWTVYLAQDKHLDYNWCGSTTEIELRMAALMDYYVRRAERDQGCWNLDGTLWHEVYRRHRGEAGAASLCDAVRRGRIGYAGNYAVLLWGVLDTETAVRACYGALPIEQSTGVRAQTALIMENPGLTWGAANVLTECGFDFLGRGIYRLRAESYLGRREAFPLFWWKAPNGKRLLVRWDLYHDTKSWGGYAEAFRLSELAGVRPHAGSVQVVDECTDPGVYAKRREYVRQTVTRYEAYGAAYPISSILLLGTGHDGWICTNDLSAFVSRFNAEPDGDVRLVDARYGDFFEAARREIQAEKLHVPTLEGSFGICWEEWAAHLAGLTQRFREAARRLRRAEAACALDALEGRGDPGRRELVRHGFTQLLKFAEHDFGGTSRQRAALSAGARATAVTQAMDIARALEPKPALESPPGAFEPEQTTFAWRGGRVAFAPERCAVASIVGAQGQAWVTAGRGPAFGEFLPTRYRSRARHDSVFPQPLDSPDDPIPGRLLCQRSDDGVEIVASFRRSGFRIETTWLFHAANPWIDVTSRLQDGWTDEPQTVQFCFPLIMDDPTYRYDAPGAILIAGAKDDGGDDLPGANPELFAGVTFAAASGGGRTALVIAPDTLLWQFGPGAVRAPGFDPTDVPAQIASMPMMNLTGNDRQFGQGGQREWTFCYRVVLLERDFDPLRAVQEAQRFATPPFLEVPGQPPAVAGLERLNVDFPGGPLLACKLAEDNRRLILRFWNVTDRSVEGSVKMPGGWSRAECCDALERPQNPLEVTRNRARFNAGPRGIATVALLRSVPKEERKKQ